MGKRGRRGSREFVLCPRKKKKTRRVHPERIYSAYSWELNPGPADNRFRLSAHCANEPQRQAILNLSMKFS